MIRREGGDSMTAHRAAQNSDFVSSVCAPKPDEAVLTVFDRFLCSKKESPENSCSEEEIYDRRQTVHVKSTLSDIAEVISELENAHSGQNSRNSNSRENSSNTKGSRHLSSGLIPKNSSVNPYEKNKSNSKSLSQHPIRSISLTPKVKDMTHSTNKSYDVSDAVRSATNQEIPNKSRNVGSSLKDLSKLKNISKKSSHVPLSSPVISKQRSSKHSKRTSSASADGTQSVFINSLPPYRSDKPLCLWSSSSGSETSNFQTGKSTSSIESVRRLDTPKASSINSKRTENRSKSSMTLKDNKNGVSSKSTKTITSNEEHLNSRNTTPKSSANLSCRTQITNSQPSDIDERSELIEFKPMSDFNCRVHLGKSTSSIESTGHSATPKASSVNSKRTENRPKSSMTLKDIKNGVSSKSMKTLRTNEEHLKSRNTTPRSSSNLSCRTQITNSQPSDTDERTELIEYKPMSDFNCLVQLGKSASSVESAGHLATPKASSINSKRTENRPKSSMTIKDIKNGVSSKSMKTIRSIQEHLSSRNTAPKYSSNPSYRTQITSSQPSDTDERSEFIECKSMSGLSRKSHKQSRTKSSNSRQSNQSNSKSCNSIKVLKNSSLWQEDSPNDFQYLPSQNGFSGYKSSLSPHQKVDGKPSQTNKAVLFSAKKMHRGERERKKPKLIKQVWATTRINTFDDSSKTFEIMSPGKFNEIDSSYADRINTIFALLPNNSSVCYVPDRSGSKH